MSSGTCTGTLTRAPPNPATEHEAHPAHPAETPADRIWVVQLASKHIPIYQRPTDRDREPLARDEIQRYARPHSHSTMPRLRDGLIRHRPTDSAAIDDQEQRPVDWHRQRRVLRSGHVDLDQALGAPPFAAWRAGLLIRRPERTPAAAAKRSSTRSSRHRLSRTPLRRWSRSRAPAARPLQRG